MVARKFISFSWSIFHSSVCGAPGIRDYVCITGHLEGKTLLARVQEVVNPHSANHRPVFHSARRCLFGGLFKRANQRPCNI